eukprot:gene3314-3799_t
MNLNGNLLKNIFRKGVIRSNPFYLRFEFCYVVRFCIGENLVTSNDKSWKKERQRDQVRGPFVSPTLCPPHCWEA